MGMFNESPAVDFYENPPQRDGSKNWLHMAHPSIVEPDAMRIVRHLPSGAMRWCIIQRFPYLKRAKTMGIMGTESYNSHLNIIVLSNVYLKMGIE